jgi:hypothetical protein
MQGFGRPGAWRCCGVNVEDQGDAYAGEDAP